MSSDAPDTATRQEVRRRRVMYVPGYDPVPPRKYRERYRTQSARQAALSGYEIEIGKKRTRGRFGWHVVGRMDGAETQADVEVMYWADIVRGSMSNSIRVCSAILIRMSPRPWCRRWCCTATCARN